MSDALPARTVTVTGSGEASAEPDEVQLSLEVHADAPSVEKALKALAERAQRVHEAAREQGLTGSLLSTTDAGVRELRDRTGEKVEGHTAYQSMRARLPRTDTVGALISALAQAAGDGLRIDSVTFAIGDVHELASQARESAFAQAKDKAQQYAALAGAELGDVLVVHDGEAPAPRMMRAAKAMAFADVPFSPGERSVRASVTVTWALH